MARMERPTASPAEKYKLWIAMAQNTPIVADTKCPPINDQGCENGLCGAPSNRTVEAPMAASIIRSSDLADEYVV